MSWRNVKRRNADADTRSLERRWQATGAPTDYVAWRAALNRVGEAPPGEVFYRELAQRAGRLMLSAAALLDRAAVHVRAQAFNAADIIERHCLIYAIASRSAAARLSKSRLPAVSTQHFRPQSATPGRDVWQDLMIDANDDVAGAETLLRDVANDMRRNTDQDGAARVDAAVRWLADLRSAISDTRDPHGGRSGRDWWDRHGRGVFSDGGDHVPWWRLRGQPIPSMTEVVETPVRRNSNSDEHLRRLERARLAYPDDVTALIAYARELDRVGRPGMAQAEALDRWVKYGVWRSGEVMRPRDPMSWERDGTLGLRVVANIVNECLAPMHAESIMRGRPSGVVYDSAVAPFQQVRPCVDERHDVPCPYDGCEACLEEGCVPPEDGGGAPVYDRKVAAVFAASLIDDQLLIGVKATPARVVNGWPGGSADPIYIVFGEHSRAVASGVASGESLRRSATLDNFKSLDAENVRVYDNGGLTDDRFTILRRGNVDGEPWALTISASVNQDSDGVWMSYESSFDPDDPDEHVGRELVPWQELLHRSVLDRLWDERGPAILRVPRETAALWADLVRLGHFW